MHRGDDAAVQNVARELFEEFARTREDRDVTTFRGLENLSERGAEGEHRARLVPGPQRALEDEERLGEVESVLRALRLLERDVGEVSVVGEARVGELGDLDDHGRVSHPRRTRSRARPRAHQ